MKVCIAEKPNVAREIASVLGANTKLDYLTFNFQTLCLNLSIHNQLKVVLHNPFRNEQNKV